MRFLVAVVIQMAMTMKQEFVKRKVLLLFSHSVSEFCGLENREYISLRWRCLCQVTKASQGFLREETTRIAYLLARLCFVREKEEEEEEERKRMRRRKWVYSTDWNTCYFSVRIKWSVSEFDATERTRAEMKGENENRLTFRKLLSSFTVNKSWFRVAVTFTLN